MAETVDPQVQVYRQLWSALFPTAVDGLSPLIPEVNRISLDGDFGFAPDKREHTEADFPELKLDLGRGEDTGWNSDPTFATFDDEATVDERETNRFELEHYEIILTFRNHKLATRIGIEKAVKNIVVGLGPHLGLSLVVYDVLPLRVIRRYVRNGDKTRPQTTITVPVRLLSNAASQLE